jgi:IS4 transposase
LGPGDELVEFQVSSQARRKDPSLPTHFDARVIKYQRKGYAPQFLITSLIDEKRFPAAELRALYHERWEIELGFGELKTDMLDRVRRHVK